MPIDYTRYTFDELYYTELHDKNDVDVCLRYAKEYYNDQQNYEKALEWYYKAVLQYNGEGKCQVGNMYRCGLGVPKDEQIETEEKEKGIDSTSNNNVIIRTLGNTQGETSTPAIYHDQIKSEIGHDQRSNLINRDSFYKEIAILKQDQTLKGEEIKQLEEQLRKFEAKLDDNRDNDLNYDSSDNKSNRENDMNYDSECSNDQRHNDMTNII